MFPPHYLLATRSAELELSELAAAGSIVAAACIHLIARVHKSLILGAYLLVGAFCFCFCFAFCFSFCCAGGGLLRLAGAGDLSPG